MLSAAVFVLILSLGTVQATAGEKRSACYGDLGCFENGAAFISMGRPINIAPQSPSEINTRFMLYTRQNQANGSLEFLNANNFASLKNSYFSSARPTKVVVHGFLQTGFVSWMGEMKDELLKYGNYNVILVDWGDGSGFPYTQATANTRVVGAEIAKLIKTLQTQMHARPEDFHLIGHSLGAHICGYAGERTPNLSRISGLDPAGPYFENTDPIVRLDPTDAAFVDVMHTDAENLIHLPHFGLGTSQACGHVDYYPNSGKDQAGCDRSPIEALRLENFDLYNGAKDVFACNHLRAFEYFTESINSVCPFEGYQCRDYQSFEKGLCMPCSGERCGFMGFHADRVKPTLGQQNVGYYLDTGDKKPYCRYHYQIKVTFGKISSASEQKGQLFLNLIGANGQLGELPVTADYISILPGHTYGFMMKSTHDIGRLSRITFKWAHDSHWYNPLSWSLFSHPALYVESVDIVNGETQDRHKFCGFNAQIDADTTRTLNQQC